jgi:hypothetical protein
VVDDDPEARQLAAERKLIEEARMALIQGDPRHALVAVERHKTQFAAGHLVEERESLWVKALVASGDRDAAVEHADRFRGRFPRSIFLPVVEGALRSAPSR